jgi:acetoin utilization deacetylase AcuC-like enzyme
VRIEYCDGQALFVLESGYDPELLGTCVIETIAGFEQGREVDPADHAAVPAA